MLPLPVGERILWHWGLFLLAAVAALRLPRICAVAWPSCMKNSSSRSAREQQEGSSLPRAKSSTSAGASGPGEGAATRPHYRIDLQPPFGPDVVEDSATLLGRAFFAGRARPGHRRHTARHDRTGRFGSSRCFCPAARCASVRAVRRHHDAPVPAGFLKLVERWQPPGRAPALRRLSFFAPSDDAYARSGQFRLGTPNGPPIELADLLRQHEGCSLLLFANRLVVHTPRASWTGRARCGRPRSAPGSTPIHAWMPSAMATRAPGDRILLARLPRLAVHPDGLLAADASIGTPAEGVQVPPWSPPPALSRPCMARWVDVWLGLGALVPDAALNQLEVLRQKLLLSDALPDPAQSVTWNG